MQMHQLLFTEPGIVTLEIFVLSSKALDPIVVTEYPFIVLGIEICEDVPL